MSLVWFEPPTLGAVGTDYSIAADVVSWHVGGADSCWI